MTAERRLMVKPFTFPTAIVMFLVSLFVTAPTPAVADWLDSRCDIYPSGSDQGNDPVPCVFSQRQGNVTISLPEDIYYDLTPTGESPGSYLDANGKSVYRQSGLGEAGQIFRFEDKTIYIYWDTAGIPDNNSADTPYSTANFDATMRLECKFNNFAEPSDCAAGVKRGPQAGQAVISIMRPDGTERILQFDGDTLTTPDAGKIEIQHDADLWLITIDGCESYNIPQAAIDGG